MKKEVPSLKTYEVILFYNDSVETEIVVANNLVTTEEGLVYLTNECGDVVYYPHFDNFVRIRLISESKPVKLVRKTTPKDDGDK
jgi:hypothetical protein